MVFSCKNTRTIILFTKSQQPTKACACVRACVCVCVRERERLMRHHHDGFGYALTSSTVVAVCFVSCISKGLHTCAQLHVDLTTPLMSNLSHYICSCPPPLIRSLFLFFFFICAVIIVSTAPYFYSLQS